MKLLNLVKKIFVVGFSFACLIYLAGCVHAPITDKSTSEELKQRVLQSAMVHTELAGQYYRRGQYRVAIEEAGIALKSKPDYAPAYNMLGLIYMDLQEDARAEENFDRALNFAGTDPDIHNNYGWFLCQRRQNRIEQAISHFMRAISDSLYDAPEKSYANAGLCVLKLPDYDRARTFFREALIIRPGYALARLGLIELDLKKGNLETAESEMSRHLQAYPATAENLWLAVRIAQAKNDINARANYAFQLQKRFPDSKEAKALRAGKVNHD
ncbi:MAG: type IV pilus biogenesis/stability protein PilW [Nitrosomonas sp.]|nr:type IV pilus biogenesis/stability protein PilW [Nitrosomonas sp.]